MSQITDNLAALERRIENACHQFGRQRNEIMLVAVTKTVGPVEINEVLSAGLCHLGENKVQEAERKIPLIDKTDKALTWHMIGHLQTNKTRKAVGLFDTIESVDSVKLAGAINEESAKVGITKQILLEVNSSGETSKYGLEPGQVISIAKEINRMENLQISGLMTVGPFTEDLAQIEKAFKATRDLFVRLRYELGDKINILSM
jgi:pyridoxal phosphate enzyme (YggS family)